MSWHPISASSWHIVKQVAKSLQTKQVQHHVKHSSSIRQAQSKFSIVWFWEQP